MSACTSQNRYPSPSERFGPYGAGPFFLHAMLPRGYRQVLEQGGPKTAENCNTDLGDFQANPDMLESALIIMNIGGRKQCRSDSLSWWHFFPHRLPDVWRMISSVPLPVQPPVPLLPMSRMVMCLPVRLSAQALVRSVMMQGCVTKTSNSFRVAYPFMTTHETTTAGAPSQWFFMGAVNVQKRGRAPWPGFYSAGSEVEPHTIMPPCGNVQRPADNCMASTERYHAGLRRSGCCYSGRHRQRNSRRQPHCHGGSVPQVNIHRSYSVARGAKLAPLCSEFGKNTIRSARGVQTGSGKTGAGLARIELGKAC